MSIASFPLHSLPPQLRSFSSTFRTSKSNGSCQSVFIHRPNHTQPDTSSSIETTPESTPLPQCQAKATGSIYYNQEQSMEVIHQSPLGETAEEGAVKRQRFSETEDHEIDASVRENIIAWLFMDEDQEEESGSHLMDFSELYPENELMVDRDLCCGNGAEAYTQVRFIDNPYSSTSVRQPSSSYVTINGNGETCGSSFSDSDTSVMASIDMRSLNFNMNVVGKLEVEWRRQVDKGGAWRVSDEMTRDHDVVLPPGEEMDGWDAFVLDDQVLARFLGEQMS